nr:heavy metal-associated isoprenylated plant protein 41-like protein [Ipomoea batatas]
MAKGRKTKGGTTQVVNPSTCSSTDANAVIKLDLEDAITLHKDSIFTLSINDEEKWAKHYSSYHKILLVGEGDFSFSASLAVAFASASNLTATSLHSKKVLRKDYEKAVYNIEEVKGKGGKVMYGVDATTMASHPTLKSLAFDRILFNFPYAVIPKNGKDQLWRHQSLVRGYLKTAKEIICENGEIHITQRTDGGFDAWRIEYIASQLGLELEEAVDFNICDYPGYTPKWGMGNEDGHLHFPSKTYKFRLPHPHSNISQCRSAIVWTAPLELGVESGITIHDKDYEVSTKLLEAIGCEQKENTSSSSNYCGNHNLEQYEMGQEMDGGVAAEEKWVKHYSSSHKMLLVGEGDFSFSTSLATAFGSAHNMIATSLDSEKFASENYSEAISNMEELKRTGCMMIFGVDATRMAHHPSLIGLMFDRIIFNFPYAVISKNDSCQDILWRHQSLVRGFLRTAKQMIHENGEVHITHRTDGFYSSWRIKFIASQLGLELIEAVDFNISDYPGYNAKSGTGSSGANFEWCPSKTYKFRHPHPESASCSADPEMILNLSEHSEESWSEESEMVELDQEDISSPTSSYFPNHYLMHNEEEKWAKHYSSCHEILLVGEGDFSFSASLAAAFGSAANMTATSLDSEEFLKSNYCLATVHLKELKRRGCKVIHGVDATSMANHPYLIGSTFDRIIFNFPHSGIFKSQGHRRISQIRHQALVREFLGNAKQLLGENGEIHITHKSNGFHLQWNIVSLAIEQGLELADSVDFDVSDYPGYSNKYGFGGDRSFDFLPSKTYMFRHPGTLHIPWDC